MLGTDLITFHWSSEITAVASLSLLFYTHTLPLFIPLPPSPSPSPVLPLPLSPGLPLGPVELEVTGDSPHKLQLSWSPPFSLPGETISYSLLIQDLATGLNRTVEPLSLTVFTHQLSEMEALACHYFIFSVFSLNEVGLSINSSYSTPVIHPSGETPFHTTHSTTLHNTTYISHSLQLYVQNTTANVHIYNITAMYKLTCIRLCSSLNFNLSLSLSLSSRASGASGD